MTKEKDWPNLTDAEISKEIQLRRSFIGECVGWLMPRILEGEIERLQALRLSRYAKKVQSNSRESRCEGSAS